MCLNVHARISDHFLDGDTRLSDLVRRVGAHLEGRGGHPGVRHRGMDFHALEAWRDAVVDHVALLWEVSGDDGRWRALNILGLGLRKSDGGRARQVPADYLSALSTAKHNATGTGVRSASQLAVGMAAVQGPAQPLLSAKERKARRGKMQKEERSALSQGSVHVSARTADKLVRMYDGANYFFSSRSCRMQVAA